jgi:hypothetical protein
MIIFSLIAVGCASNQVPSQLFHGLNHIYLTQDTVLNVVYVHGMGGHPLANLGYCCTIKSITHELGFEEDGINRVA